MDVDWINSELWNCGREYDINNIYLSPSESVLGYLDKKYDNMPSSFRFACKILNKLWNELYLPMDYRKKYYEKYMKSAMFDNYCEVIQELHYLKDCRYLIITTLDLLKEEINKNNCERKVITEINKETRNKIYNIKISMPWLDKFIVNGENMFLLLE